MILHLPDTIFPETQNFTMYYPSHCVGTLLITCHTTHSSGPERAVTLYWGGRNVSTGCPQSWRRWVSEQQRILQWNVQVYEGPVLRSEDEKDFLLRIEENKRSKKQYDENEINFGKLYLFSDLNEEPERIYRLYKQREYVEYAFNVYNNDLEADRSYLGDDHKLFSYMFLNLLSLYLHFQILNMLDGVKDQDVPNGEGGCHERDSKEGKRSGIRSGDWS